MGGTVGSCGLMGSRGRGGREGRGLLFWGATGGAYLDIGLLGCGIGRGDWVGRERLRWGSGRRGRGLWW